VGGAATEQYSTVGTVVAGKKGRARVFFVLEDLDIARGETRVQGLRTRLPNSAVALILMLGMVLMQCNTIMCRLDSSLERPGLDR
jgi:hypothetical protein